MGMMREQLPPTITVRLPSGIRIEASLKNWPAEGNPIYQISIEQLEGCNIHDTDAFKEMLQQVEKHLK